MRLKKVVTVLSLAIVVSWLAMPAWAQKGKKVDPNPYTQAEIDEQAARVVTTETAIGTLTNYKGATLPQVDAATSTDWSLHSLDLSNSRYVPLDQIKTSNAKSLVAVWAQQTYISPNTFLRDNNPSSTQPVVVDGIMYVTDFPGNIVALDAATGERIWSFRVNTVITEDENLVSGWPNRGVTYADGVIYAVTGASIFALDPKTGAPVESFGKKGRVDPVLDILKTKYPDILKPIQKGFAYVMAPQYSKGVLITGTGLAEATPNPPGGLVIATDAKTGKTLWSFNTIPQDASEQGWDIAGPTWTGGGPRTGGCIWETPSIDPELGLVFVTAGNPMPFNASSFYGSRRHGLNLFSDSTIALDMATGKMKWYFQQTHHDAWDYDSAQQPILYDTQIGGKTVKALAMGTKGGLLYFLNRETGLALPGTNIFEVPVQTGTPGTAAGEEIWPTQPFQYSAGGHIMNNVPLVGIPTNATQVPVPRYTPPAAVANQLNPPGGTQVQPAALSLRTRLLYFVGNRYLNAWDMSTGEQVWQVVLPAASGATGGLVATSGDVLFASDNAANAGHLYAFDARTGEQLWSFNTGGTIKAPPAVYMLNGREYVAIRSGVTIFTFALPN